MNKGDIDTGIVYSEERLLISPFTKEKKNTLYFIF